MVAGLLPEVAYGSWRLKLERIAICPPGAQLLVVDGALVVGVAILVVLVLCLGEADTKWRRPKKSAVRSCIVAVVVWCWEDEKRVLLRWFE